MADFVVLDNLHDVNVEMVFKRGKLVYDGHEVEIANRNVNMGRGADHLAHGKRPAGRRYRASL